MDPRDPDDAKDGYADGVRELAGLFIASRRADLERLEAAAAAGDLATIRAVGHVFHGSAAPFGFAEAGRIGALIEEAAVRGDLEAARALVPGLRASLSGGGA